MAPGKLKEPDAAPAANIKLDERLVRETLKINPLLSQGKDVKEFIRQTTGHLNEAAAKARQEADGGSVAQREGRLHSLFEDVAKLHRIADAKLDIQRKALAQDERKVRDRCVGALVEHLAAHAKTVAEARTALKTYKALLEALATSDNEVLQLTAQKKKGGKG